HGASPEPLPYTLTSRPRLEGESLGPSLFRGRSGFPRVRSRAFGRAASRSNRPPVSPPLGSIATFALGVRNACPSMQPETVVCLAERLRDFDTSLPETSVEDRAPVPARQGDSPNGAGEAGSGRAR